MRASWTHQNGQLLMKRPLLSGQYASNPYSADGTEMGSSGEQVGAIHSNSLFIELGRAFVFLGRRR
jgi:hypothetical protein